MARALEPEPRRVAIVRLRTGLGDLLCGVPALRALRARLPKSRITMITFAEMAPVVDRQRPWVDELLPFPGWPGIPERPPRRDAIPGFLAEAHGRRFDLAVQMYGARTAANELTMVLGARRTAGFFTPGAWRPPERASWLAYPERSHEIHRHLALMELLGAAPRGEELEFPLLADDDREAEGLRERTGLRAGRYVVVHPGATSASRRWPPERFAAVADALAAEGLRVALAGTPADAPHARAVREAMRAPVADLSGRTSLGGWAALLRGAALVVTNDSGPAHMAAALGVPGVTCFLSGDPRRWAGLDRRMHRVARAQVECNPCPHLTCPIDHRCSERLAVRDVIAQAHSALAASAP